MSSCLSHITDTLSHFLTPSPSEEEDDSGIHSNYNPPHHHHHHHAPSSRSSRSPAHSTITTATIVTLPAPSSTTSSSLLTYHTFPTLWIQGILSKISLSIIAELPRKNKRRLKSEEKLDERASSANSFVTPRTSLTDVFVEGKPVSSEITPVQNQVQSGQTHSQACHEARGGTGSLASHDGGESERCRNSESSEEGSNRVKELGKLVLEIDGVSVQLDIQEKRSDLILKVAAVDANLYREDSSTTSGKKTVEGGRDVRIWRPLLSSEKIFTSKGSALPESLSSVLMHSCPAGQILYTCTCTCTCMYLLPFLIRYCERSCAVRMVYVFFSNFMDVTQMYGIYNCTRINCTCMCYIMRDYCYVLTCTCTCVYVRTCMCLHVQTTQGTELYSQHSSCTCTCTCMYFLRSPISQGG